MQKSSANLFSFVLQYADIFSPRTVFYFLYPASLRSIFVIIETYVFVYFVEGVH